MPVLRAHDLAVALGDSQHAHHHIFGDGDRVDPGAVGNDHAALLQQIERESIEPGVDRVEPLELHPAPHRLGHVLLLVEVEPADLRFWGKLKQFLGRGKPARFDPVRQMRFEHWASHGGKNGYGHWALLKASSIGGR